MVYSRRRTLSLEVTRTGEVVVRAPLGTPERRVRAMVADHRDWLEDKLRRRRAWLEEHPEPGPEEETRLR